MTRRALLPTIVATLAVLLVLPAGSTAQATKPAPSKPAPSKPATSKQAAALQGTWIITSINGQVAAPGTPELTLTFAGDKYHQAVDGVVNERGTIKLDTAKKPMTIDLAITEGQDTGKAQLGIIEVTGDKLRASLDQPNAGKRPADFEGRPGEIAVVGQRKKP